MTKSVKMEKSSFTYGDYCAWPEDQRWELIEGEAYDMTPAPSRLHSSISIAFLRQLLPFFDGKPCEVHDAPFDVRFPKSGEADELVDSVVQPDILVVCDRKKLDDKGCRGAPDFIIEILSPSTASKDAIKKRRLYEKHGVKEFWLVDPVNRIVTVYSLGSKGFYDRPGIFGDEAEIKLDLFPGLEIHMAKIFPVLPKVARESPRKFL